MYCNNYLLAEYAVKHSRSHSTPSPIKPSWHSHVKEPGTFWHFDVRAHFLGSLHSLISVKMIRKAAKKTLFTNISLVTLVCSLFITAISHQIKSAMLVSETHPARIKLFSYANALFCRNICIVAGDVSENAQKSVFTHVTSIYANLLKQNKAFA